MRFKVLPRKKSTVEFAGDYPGSCQIEDGLESSGYPLQCLLSLILLILKIGFCFLAEGLRNLRNLYHVRFGD